MYDKRFHCKRQSFEKHLWSNVVERKHVEDISLSFSLSFSLSLSFFGECLLFYFDVTSWIVKKKVLYVEEDEEDAEVLDACEKYKQMIEASMTEKAREIITLAIPDVSNSWLTA